MRKNLVRVAVLFSLIAGTAFAQTQTVRSTPASSISGARSVDIMVRPVLPNVADAFRKELTASLKGSYCGNFSGLAVNFSARARRYPNANYGPLEASYIGLKFGDIPCGDEPVGGCPAEYTTQLITPNYQL